MSRNGSQFARAAFLFAALLAAPARAGTSDPAADIAAASARIAEAAAVLEAATRAPVRIAALADAVAAYEAALAALRAGVADAGARERALALGLADRRTEIARLLAALEAIGRTAPPARGLHPQGPLGAARAAAMMDRVAPALRSEAADLAAQLADLTAARDLHQKGEASLAAGVETLSAAQGTLAATMTAAGALASNSPALTMMARNSESLSALATALAGSGESPAPAAAGEGPLLWPVVGEVLLHYDEPDAAGVRRPGVVLSAPPLALVRAPADAVVRYAGPFLEYGYVVVLEPDASTMLVLAGLAQLQVGTGAAVRRGDLLGLLGGRALGAEAPDAAALDAEETVMPETGTGAGVSETLYIEVRHGRGPVDPEPLFAGENG